MGGLGIGELVIILAIALLVFGAGKLPQVGSSLGKAIRDFRRATSGAEDPEEAPREEAAPAEALPPGTPPIGTKTSPAAEETPRS